MLEASNIEYAMADARSELSLVRASSSKEFLQNNVRNNPAARKRRNNAKEGNMVDICKAS